MFIELEIVIKTVNGSMCILINEFLNMRNIAKVKKLLKLIRTSNTPEVEKNVKTYVVEYLADVDTRLKKYANKGVSARTELRENEPELEKLIKERDKWKKNTPPYKQYMEKVKEQREKMRHLKAVWKSQENNFDAAMKNKEFYKKVLNLLDE